MTGRTVAIASLFCVLAACATTPPPTGLLDEAEMAIERARAAGAVEEAPIELRLARERLAGARLAIESRENERARRLADQSMINAELAVAKTAAARAREAAREQEQANRKLREELATEGDRS